MKISQKSLGNKTIKSNSRLTPEIVDQSYGFVSAGNVERAIFGIINNSNLDS